MFLINREVSNCNIFMTVAPVGCNTGLNPLCTPEGTVFFSAGTKNGLLSAGKEGSSLLGAQGESTFSAEAEIPLLHLTLRCVGTIADELQPLMRHRM